MSVSAVSVPFLTSPVPAVSVLPDLLSGGPDRTWAVQAVQAVRVLLAQRDMSGLLTCVSLLGAARRCADGPDRCPGCCRAEPWCWVPRTRLAILDALLDTGGGSAVRGAAFPVSETLPVLLPGFPDDSWFDARPAQRYASLLDRDSAGFVVARAVRHYARGEAACALALFDGSGDALLRVEVSAAWSRQAVAVSDSRLWAAALAVLRPALSDLSAAPEVRALAARRVDRLAGGLPADLGRSAGGGRPRRGSSYCAPLAPAALPR